MCAFVTVSVCTNKVFCVFFYLSNLVGTKQSTGMWLPAATPVVQTLSLSLGLSFGLKILKARLKI